jgi:hypothetical protein
MNAQSTKNLKIPIPNSVNEVPCLAFMSILHNKAREIAKQRTTE